MDHRTIQRNAAGELELIACLCGEDHGPSLAEQVVILDADNRRLSARVAELEAEREATGTEWGVRWDDGTVHAPARNSEQANRKLSEQLGHELLRRDVFAPGPWRVATE